MKRLLKKLTQKTSIDPLHILDKPSPANPTAAKSGIITGQGSSVLIGNKQVSKKSLLIFAAIFALFGAYFVFRSFAAVNEVSTNTSVVDSDSTCQRPYTADSAWNTPIVNPVYSPNTQAHTDAIAAGNQPISSDGTQYTFPVYYVNNSTPKKTIRFKTWFSDVQSPTLMHNYRFSGSTRGLDASGGGYVAAVDASGNPVGVPSASTNPDPQLDAIVSDEQGVPFPDNAAPATGSDAQIIIINTETGEAWGFTFFEGAVGGILTTGSLSHYNNNWNGVPPASSNDPSTVYGEPSGGPFRQIGAGIPPLSGLIRPCEVQRAVDDPANYPDIGHALQFAYNWPARTFDAVCNPDSARVEPEQHLYPATQSDGSSCFPDVLEGTRLQLDPTISDATIRSWKGPDGKFCIDACFVVAKTLQKYGMYVIDQSGRPKIRPEFESTAKWTTLAAKYQVVDKTVNPIPYSAFKVVQSSDALPPPPPTAPTATLIATPASVASGNSSNLTWTSTNATTCNATGAWLASGAKPTSNSVGESTGALTANKTYTLTCSNSTTGLSSAPSSVTVSVAAPDTTPPAATWQAPAEGATVSGQLNEAANNCRVVAYDPPSTADGTNISRVQFFLNGTPINTESTKPYSCIINTAEYPNGTYTLGAQAFDTASPANASPIVTRQVTFNNTTTPPPSTDTTPPAVSMAPPTGSTIAPTGSCGTACSGGIAFTANATDNVAVTKVDFLIDNVYKFTDNDASNGHTYTIDSKGLANGSHTIKAIAYDGAGNGPTTSAEVSFTVNNPDTTAPTAPTNLRLNGTVTATSVPLTWDAASDNVGVVKYNILRNGAVIGTSTSLTYTDNTAVASTTYSYQVQAVDEATNTSPSSEPPLSVTTPAAPDTTAPTTPTNLTATAASSTQINLTWTASTDTGGSGLAGYNIYRNGSATPLNATPITATSYGDAAGLAASTSYSYTVEAIDRAGNKSPLTAAVSAMTAAPTTQTYIVGSDSDAYIRENAPNTKYGSQTTLIADDDTDDRNVLLKYNVNSVKGRKVTSAKLRLYANNGSNKGGDFYRLTSNNWTGSTVTWNTKPASDRSTKLAALGTVTTGKFIEVDLTSRITGDGIYGFEIDSTSTDEVGYNSNDHATASTRPQLVITVSN